MFNTFEEEARKVLINAKKEIKDLKHPYVGSEHLLLSILKTKNDVSKKLKEYDLDYHKFRKQVVDIVGIGSIEPSCFLYTPLLKRVMETAMIDSKENNNGIVTINHLFSALLEEGEGVAIRIMLGMDIDLDLLYKDFSYKIVNNKKHKHLLIEEIGVDMTKKAINGELDPVVGRDQEIKRVLEILSRRKKNNPLLIGEAGVGKTAIVEELSRLIALGKVPRNLKNKRIISLDMSSAVAGTKYRGEFEERINKILKELEDNDDIILFIDEIHTLVGAGGAEGAIDASNIFKPALARNKMRVIGATTSMEYKKYIEEDKALERRFQKIVIDVPDKDTVKDILMSLKDTYENYHHVCIDEEMIDLIINLSDKYIYNRYQPDKAIDILDEVCAHVSLKDNIKIKKYNNLNDELRAIIEKKKKAILNNDFEQAQNLKIEENKLMDKINKLELNLYKKDNNRNIKKDDIMKIVSRKTNIPLYQIDNKKIKNIDKLNNYLKKHIINQDKVIDQLVQIYKQIVLGLKDNKCHSFMFAGPTGVGKTELAKLFGSYLSKSVIRLDMSEYSEAHSISKIIGSPAGYVGYNDNKNVLSKVKSNPFSIVVLDEIDKAHISIIDLFFQILDEGIVKDATGEEVNFKNSIIIMTTNVGFDMKTIGFNNQNNSQLREQFGKSFMNRVDNILYFDYLDRLSIKKVTQNCLGSLKKKYSDMIIKISRNVIDEIIDKSKYREYGARQISKIINNYLVPQIIDSMLQNNHNIYLKNLNDEVRVG